jgi:phosphopantetheine adenylyltransferase
MRFLLITYFRKPGGQIDEQVTVSKKVRNSDLQTCNVIVDYQNKTVSKCIIEGKRVDTDFEKMNQYYKQIYPNLIEQLEKNNRGEQ